MEQKIMHLKSIHLQLKFIVSYLFFIKTSHAIIFNFTTIQ